MGEGDDLNTGERSPRLRFFSMVGEEDRIIGSEAVETSLLVGRLILNFLEAFRGTACAPGGESSAITTDSCSNKSRLNGKRSEGGSVQEGRVEDTEAKRTSAQPNYLQWFQKQVSCAYETIIVNETSKSEDRSGVEKKKSVRGWKGLRFIWPIKR